eukprot:6766_1
MPLGVNYIKYLKAINIIISLMSNKFNPVSDIDDEIVSIVMSFMNLEDEKKSNFPQYPLKLFDCIRNNWTKPIVISISKFLNNKYYFKLKHLFLHDMDKAHNNWYSW